MEVKEGHEAMEAQALSPRCLQIVVQKRIQRIQKKKNGSSRKELAAEKFCRILKSACAPVAARAPLLAPLLIVLRPRELNRREHRHRRRCCRARSESAANHSVVPSSVRTQELVFRGISSCCVATALGIWESPNILTMPLCVSSLVCLLACMRLVSIPFLSSSFYCSQAKRGNQ